MWRSWMLLNVPLFRVCFRYQMRSPPNSQNFLLLAQDLRYEITCFINYVLILSISDMKIWTFHVIHLAATITSFAWNSEFHWTSLYSLCEAEQSFEASYIWKSECLATTTLWGNTYLCSLCWFFVHLFDIFTHLYVFIQGVMEAIRISCAGYPTKRPFIEFIDRFGILAPEVLDGRYHKCSHAFVFSTP